MELSSLKSEMYAMLHLRLRETIVSLLLSRLNLPAGAAIAFKNNLPLQAT